MGERVLTPGEALLARLARGRRTHGAYPSEETAIDAAHNLCRLLNGTPAGYTMALLPRMGAVALISYRSDR